MIDPHDVQRDGVRIFRAAGLSSPRSLSHNSASRRATAASRSSDQRLTAESGDMIAVEDLVLHRRQQRSSANASKGETRET